MIRTIDSMRYYSRLYVMIVSQYIKGRMQYRADFIISSVGQGLMCLTGIFTLWVLFASIPNLAGWSFNEMVFMYGFYLLATSPVQIFFDNIWRLRMHVQSGEFIKYYFRPINMMFYFLSEIFDLKGLTQLVLGIVALVYASIQLHIVWTLPRLVLLFITVFSSSLVITSIMTIAACSSFWIVNSFPILALAFRLKEFSPYPLTIFNGIFKFIFTYMLPLGFIAFYPAQLFLRPGEASVLVYISPLVGIGLFAVAYLVWQKGVNSWTGTGS
jgi:ABC-2 type transport system permease protein